jgi:hypothetical protein
MASFTGRVGQNSNTASATLAVTALRACPAGGVVLAVLRGFNNATPTGVTDSKGNTYTVEDGSLLATLGAGVYKSVLATALVTTPVADTITVTFPSAQAAGICMIADLLAGLGSCDASASSSPAGASPQTQAITVHPDDQVVWGAEIFNGSGATITAGGGLTAAGTAITTPFSLQTGYDAAPSPGTFTASWTISSTGHSSILFTRAYAGPSHPAGGFLTYA